MDFSLRCNSLKCRRTLNDRAVVTTCSHIFCVPCSESLGLANPNGNTRVCPACDTHLSNPDDAVVTQLNPTEDYKTSVLSGLSPSVIMECAGRGLAFYSYQTTQEIVYQEFLARSLTDKYSTLSSQMDKIVHDANTEIMTLRDKLAATHEEQKSLQEKNHELAEAYREKAKSQQQLQRLYTSLKHQQVAAGMELAAEHDAENVLQTAANGHFSTGTHRMGPPMQTKMRTNGSVDSGSGGGGRHYVNPWEYQVQGNRGGLQSSRSLPVNATPSSQRTRFPPLYDNQSNNNVVGNNTLYSGTPYRSALNNLDPNMYGGSNSASYGGMSAGMKAGRPQNTPNNRKGYDGRPTVINGLSYR